MYSRLARISPSVVVIKVSVPIVWIFAIFSGAEISILAGYQRFVPLAVAINERLLSMRFA